MMQMKNVPFTRILKSTMYVFCNIIMVYTYIYIYIYIYMYVCVCVCVCILDSTSLLRNILNIELSEMLFKVGRCLLQRGKGRKVFEC